MKYCNSLIQYSRFRTREVKVGNTVIGGSNPIRVQTMTNTDTVDVQGTVEQCIRSIEAGADLVRITVPKQNDADSLVLIRKQLTERGYHHPLVADIHFNPRLAELSAEVVEKVRINPGNFIDKIKTFAAHEYTDAEYAAELNKIREKLLPLLNICKSRGVAIRLGVNHGSLSDRVMSRYGDSPEGMVQSVMEFLRICEAEGFQDIVISMKASNTRIMVQSYRLLMANMIQNNMNYPLHLGVTEAGDGDDGRIKSAVGIGTLLADGIGDTIRVSLTEEPEKEVPVGRKLAKYFESRTEHESIRPVESPVNPFEYNRRVTSAVGNIGGENVPVVVLDIRGHKSVDYSDLGFKKTASAWLNKENAVDYLLVDQLPEERPVFAKYILSLADWKSVNNNQAFPLLTATEFLSTSIEGQKFVSLNYAELNDALISRIKADPAAVLFLGATSSNPMVEQRAAIFEFIHQGCTNPVVAVRSFNEDVLEDFQIKSGADFGALLIDGLVDGVLLANKGQLSLSDVHSTAFTILQASRVRTVKTEYISCPGCGRTLFDLQETTGRVKKQTVHLKGLKIAVMGCIVNGIGEMADANYGYVGSGPGKITLYKEKTVVKRNIPEQSAVEELVNLIKDHGDWVDPE